MSNTDPFNDPLNPEDSRLNQGEEKEDAIKRPLLEIYNEGIRKLESAGFRLEPSQGGNYALHHIRSEMHPGDLDGLSIPKKFSMYRNIDDEANVVLNDLTTEISNWQLEDKNRYRLFEPIVNPAAQKTKNIHAIACMMMQRNTQKEVKRQNRYEDGVSLCGGNGGRAFVPRHEWFSEEVRKLTAGDLLTILPRAEMEIFLLILGRIVVGRDNSRTVEGTEIDHTFRALAILVGLKGGIGKSTLMRYINQALAYLGYEVQTLENPGSRFGWGRICRSDLGYIDDLTRKSQKKFIEADNVKTIVSNEALSTEQKGIDSISIQAKTVLIANSNDFNQADLLEVDHGILSRLNFLQCHSDSSIKEGACVSEATKDSPDYRTRPHWEWVAEQTGADKKTLACWLLRLAADKFLKATGYEWSEKWNRYKKTGEDNLEETFQWWRSHCKLGFTNHSTENFLQLARIILLLYCEGKPELEPEVRESLLSQRSARLLHFLSRQTVQLIADFDKNPDDTHMENWLAVISGVLKDDYEDRNRPPIHPWLAFTDMDSQSCVKQAKKSVREQEMMGASYNAILKVFFNSLYTKKGFRYVGNPVWLNSYWEAAQEDDYILRGMVAQIKEESLVPSGPRSQATLWDQIVYKLSGAVPPDPDPLDDL